MMPEYNTLNALYRQTYVKGKLALDITHSTIFFISSSVVRVQSTDPSVMRLNRLIQYGLLNCTTKAGKGS